MKREEGFSAVFILRKERNLHQSKCTTDTEFNLHLICHFYNGCFCLPSLQPDHSWVRHTGGLRSSQYFSDGPERDAQLPGQKLKRENERTHRPTDQQQLRKDAAPENSRAPEQRRENRKNWVAPTHPVPVPWSAAFRRVCVSESVCVCGLSERIC